MAPEQDKVSSQAGLASLRAGQNVNGAPAPGEPGSRFNPIVRERNPAPEGQASAAAGIRSVMDRRDRINASQARRDYTPPTMEAPEHSGDDFERA